MDHVERLDRKFELIIASFVLILIFTTTFTGAIFRPEIDSRDLDDDENTTDLYALSKEQKTNTISADREGLFLDIVDESEDLGKYTSIDIKEGGEKKLVFISYYSESSETLKIAQNDMNDPEGDWERWTIDYQGNVGSYSSLEVDDDMRAHIAYYDVTNTRLKYTLWCGENHRLENTEVIDDSGEVGKYTSLVLDENENPRVSYHDSSRGALKYAEQNNGDWKTVTVSDQGENLGRHTSLALDSDSEPHISFYDWERRDLKYAERIREDEKTEWEISTIKEAGELVGKYTSLELDKGDNAHISCYEWTDGYKRLKYVTNSVGSEWTSEEVSSSDPSGTYTSIEIYGSGNPLISYHEWGEENLRLAVKDGEGWKNVEIDTKGRVGSHTSIEYIGEAETHISYYDQFEGDLRHARYFFKNRTPLAPQSFNTRSEYGDVVLEWESPLYDGIKAQGNHILGYHIYRSNGDDFEKIDNVTGFSYTDEIEIENETDTYEYRVAAVNRKGVGDNTSIIKTRARYFSYERSWEKTNEYSILADGLLPLSNEEEGPYEIRWDLDYEAKEGPTWEDENFEEEMYKKYDEVGLKSILLEYENGNGDRRRCLQSAWVLGQFDVTSTYEQSGSEERFFHLPEDKEAFEDLSSEDSLKNTYKLETQQSLPYEYVEFEFLGKDETVNESGLEQDKEIWEKTFSVSDSKEDTEVSVIPYLKNKYRNEVESPISFPHQIELKNEKNVEVIDTPTWFPHLLDAFFGDNLEINNIEDEGNYVGWEVEFEIPELEDDDKLKDALDQMDISGTPELDILDDLGRFFGGNYGFEMELFPDREITFDNDLNFETTLIEFYTDVDEGQMGIDSFDGELGNSLDYAADPEIEVSAGISIDLLVKEDGIRVAGGLELEVGAGIQIDIPLKSIGFAEVGLTAEIGGEISVEYEVGALGYEYEKGLSLDPGDGEIPIEFLLNFGGGPYGEVGAGLARIEGRLVLEVIVGLELPSKDTGIDHAGKFVVEVSAGWGLWSKTEEWELYSTEDDSTSLTSMDTNAAVKNKMFETDRLATRDYGMDEETTLLGIDELDGRKNVGPRADPQIVSLDKEKSLAVWSELSKDSNGDVQSDLFMQKISDGAWENDAQVITTRGDMAYDPELIEFKEDDKVGLIYKEIEERPGEFETVEELEDYYTNDKLRGKTWCAEKGWSDLDLHHSVENQSITSFDVDIDQHDDIHIVYRSSYPSLDMFEASSSEEANIGVLKQQEENWKEIFEREDNLPQSSRPSIEVVDGNENIVYTRTVDDVNGKYDEVCYNRTVLVTIDGDEKIIRETPNTTSYQLLSEEDGDLVVSWVEDHTEIRRIVACESFNGSEDEITTLYSGSTISGLTYHVNDSSKYYVFQKGRYAVPTLIESSGDRWSKKRSILSEKAYAADQLDLDFGRDDPTMITVEKDELIESWHRAHYRFDGSVRDGMVADRSEETNIGHLKGNWTREKHDPEKLHGRYGYYLNFKGEESKIVVDHSSTLNVTENTEDFTVTALIKENYYEDGSYLMKKEGSWGLLLDNKEVVIELWDNDEKNIIPTSMEFPSCWTFFALRYEEDWLNVTLKNYESSGSLDENTVNVYLNGFGSLSSSVEPLKLAEGSGTLLLDDFRLVERYLPNASIEKIFRTSYPNFDAEYSITTKNIPPYANFTHSEETVVGVPIEFTAHSRRDDLNYSWSFEGVEKHGKEIEYQFKETGYHTVNLKAMDMQTGAETEYEKTLHVIDVNPPRFDAGLEVFEIYEENNSVRIGWDEAEGESEPFEYRIHHDTGEDAEFDHKYWRDSTEETSIVIEDLDHNFDHHLLVSVVNDLGLTNTSAEHVSFEFEGTIPLEFDGLQSTYVNHSEMRVGLAWYEVDHQCEAISYNIYHSRKEDMSFEDPIESTDQTEKQILVSEIGKHYFAVRAEDNERNEDDNEEVKMVEVRDTKPPEVHITSPLEGETLGHTVVVEWNASDNNSGISTYWIKRDDENWNQVEKQNYTFHNIPEGERTLTVKAVDNHNNSATDSVGLYVLGKTRPEIDFSSPSPFDGSTGVSTDIELSVDVEYEDERYLDIAFYNAEGNELIGKDEGISNGETASVEWKGLNPNTTYEWYVEADDGEYSSRSTIWNFTTSINLEEHALEINIEGEGIVDIDPKQDKYEEGTEVKLTAIPSEDWYFKDWSGDYIGTEDEIIIIMDTEKELIANFHKIDDFLLTIDIEGNGSTDPPKGTYTYEEGEYVTITAEAEEDWYFKNWIGIPQETEEEITLQMDESKEIVAVFLSYDDEKYELTHQVDGKGSVEIDPDQELYEKDTKVDITAEPEPDWKFSHWSGNITDDKRGEKEITITMDGNKSIVAHFEKVDHETEYKLSIKVEGEGSTDPEEGEHIYSSGEKVYLIADSKGDWIFSHWSGNITNWNRHEKEITITMDGDKSIIAHFEKVDHEKEYELSIEVQGEGRTNPEEGIYNYSSNEKVYVRADPKEEWNFSHWSGKITDEKREEKEMTITMDRDKRIIAHFEKLDHEKEYELSIEVEGEGSIDPEEGIYNYSLGEKVFVKAYPNEEWNFSHWSGDIKDEIREENKITITMKENKSIVGHFEKVDYEKEYELSIDVEGRGSIDPEKGLHIYSSGEKIHVIADPAENWTFSHWSGDIKDEIKDESEITITMDANMEITAHFEEKSEESEETVEDEGSTGMPSFISSFQIPLLIIFIVLIAAVIILYWRSSDEFLKK